MILNLTNTLLQSDAHIPNSITHKLLWILNTGTAEMFHPCSSLAEPDPVNAHTAWLRGWRPTIVVWLFSQTLYPNHISYLLLWGCCENTHHHIMPSCGKSVLHQVEKMDK